MKLHAHDALRSAGAIAIVGTAAGLVLAGCGPSSGPAASPATASATAKPSATGSAASSHGSAPTTDSAASVPFPVGVGDTWTYQTTDGTTVNKITSVTQVPSGRKVGMDSTITVAGTTTHLDDYYILEPNGEISVPFSQFGSAASGSGYSVKLLSGGIFWPSAADLASGQVLHSSLELQYTVGGSVQKNIAQITVKGLGTQTVTVPAGTYSNATVVDMIESVKFDGISVAVNVKTWLATGVGPVETEVSTADGAAHDVDIMGKDVLTSFAQG
jgi:hypothetical protein